MPRFLRIFLTGLSFAVFFGGSIALGVIVFPVFFLLALGNRERHRTRCTRFVSRGYGTFLFWMRVSGLADWKNRVKLPPELEGKPFVLVANHPTLVDVIYFLNGLPGLTCVVKNK